MKWRKFSEHKPCDGKNNHAGRDYAYLYLRCLHTAYDHKLTAIYSWANDTLIRDGVLLDKYAYEWLDESDEGEK